MPSRARPGSSFAAPGRGLAFVAVGPDIAHELQRAKRMAGRGLAPEPVQQPGDDDVLFRLGKRPQRRARAGTARCSNAVVSPTVSVSYSLAAPSPSHVAKAVCFVSRLEVRPTDLQNDIAAGCVARRSHPRGHAARLERFADLQGPAALELGHDRRQLGDPRLHALVRRAGGLVGETAGDGDVMHVTRHPTTSGCRIRAMSETRTLLVEAARRHSFGGVAVAVVRKGEPAAVRMPRARRPRHEPSDRHRRRCSASRRSPRR